MEGADSGDDYFSTWTDVMELELRGNRPHLTKRMHSSIKTYGLRSIRIESVWRHNVIMAYAEKGVKAIQGLGAGKANLPISYHEWPASAQTLSYE
jgi:hypothetical protein